MNKKNATLSYAVMGPNTYLVAAVDEQALVEYCVTMGERNRIPGLLPMHHQIVNGEYLLYFDITGKRKIKDVAGAERLGTREGKKVLESLVRNLQGLAEYYLRPDMCLLEMDALFVDDHYEPFLPLIPMQSDDANSDPALREFLMVLLGECFVGEGSDPFFDQALKRLLPTSFRLDDFVQAMYPAKKAETPVYGGGQNRAPAYEQSAPVSAPAPAPAPRPAVPVPPAPPAPPAEEKSAKGGLKLPVGKKKEEKTAPPAGVPIPGQKAVPVPPAPPAPAADKKGKKKEEKKEKKKKEEKPASNGLLGGLFGKKKEEEAIPVPTPVPAPAPRPADPVRRPEPVAAPAADSGSWSGTVQLVNNGATVMLGAAAAARRACLIHDGRRVELNVLPFTVGRQACNYIIDSGKVSRTHLTVLESGGVYYVKDENSSNHTYLNDVMIPPYTPTAVRDGDVLRLGDVMITLELPTA